MIWGKFWENSWADGVIRGWECKEIARGEKGEERKRGSREACGCSELLNPSQAPWAESAALKSFVLPQLQFLAQLIPSRSCCGPTCSLPCLLSLPNTSCALPRHFPGERF